MLRKHFRTKSAAYTYSCKLRNGDPLSQGLAQPAKVGPALTLGTRADDVKLKAAKASECVATPTGATLVPSCAPSS
eukprot:7225756-Prymnesium_polylepis.1